jgi:hypothetical protein
MALEVVMVALVLESGTFEVMARDLSYLVKHALSPATTGRKIFLSPPLCKRVSFVSIEIIKMGIAWCFTSNAFAHWVARS